MPSIDSGRYFLSVLLPIKTNIVVKKDGMDIPLSPVQAVRDELSVWPTAKQDMWSLQQAENSPFANSHRTHFTRLFVLPDVVYNGRDSQDTIAYLAKGVNPLVPQPVDQLTNPYLVYVADFDAPGGTEAELDSYLTELWSENSAAFTRLFQYCYGFDQVKDARTFCQFIRKGKVETTMPFNDYWAHGVPIPAVTMPWGSIKWTALAIIAVCLLIVVLLLKQFDVAWYGYLFGIIVAAIIGVGAAAWVAYRAVLKWGAKPYPMAPKSDLKSVLKSLYVQRHFVDFTEQNQGADEEALYQAFGEFIKENRPDDLEGPTQKPGTLGLKGLA